MSQNCPRGRGWGGTARSEHPTFTQKKFAKSCGRTIVHTMIQWLKALFGSKCLHDWKWIYGSLSHSGGDYVNSVYQCLKCGKRVHVKE